MTVRLMLTCLCDAYYGEVGIATARVLEAVGCRIEFPEDQTCCGQPAFNAGDRRTAAQLAQRTRRVFAGGAPVVAPSASCVAMTRHGYGTLGQEELPAFELCRFLVEELGIEKWPPRQGGAYSQRRVAYHPACHQRALGGGDHAERLLRTIPGIELVPIGDAEQCCGFGGAFSLSHAHLSSAIGREKLNQVPDVEELVGSDMGCLMHLRGLAEAAGSQLRIRHVAELLAEALG